MTNENEIQNTELIHREPIDGTPFQIITIEEGSFVALGRFRVTDIQSEENCFKMIENKDWNLILATVSVILSSIKPLTNE